MIEWPGDDRGIARSHAERSAFEGDRLRTVAVLRKEVSSDGLDRRKRP